jgi:hypothetical protein
VSFRPERSPVKQDKEQSGFHELAGLYEMLLMGSPGTAHGFFEKYGDRMAELEKRLGPEEAKRAFDLAGTSVDRYCSTFY